MLAPITVVVDVPPGVSSLPWSICSAGEQAPVKKMWRSQLATSEIDNITDVWAAFRALEVEIGNQGLLKPWLLSGESIEVLGWYRNL